VAAIELYAGVLHVHAGHRRHLELCLHGCAERAARDAVAAGQERGAGDEDVGSGAGDQWEHLRDRPLGMLGGVVVAADHRGHDRARRVERLLDGSRGADGAFDDLRADARLFLAAELAEELIDVADDSQGHHRTSAITRVAPTCSIAPQSPP
jgi:hypothetical protein